MLKRTVMMLLATLIVGSLLAVGQTEPLVDSLLRQLVDINTTDAASTAPAAQAMAQHLLAAGFPASDVQVIGPNPKKMNLVARLHGTGEYPPILLIGHLDVVAARRADWNTDPFHMVEQDGYYYGRGTQDMKDNDAIFIAALIRMKQAGYRPDRDIIVALTAAEETGSDNGVAWLLHNRRALINAAYVINGDGGGVDAIHGKPVYLAVDASEKLYADFQLQTTDRGGHSSLPRPDNAIYELNSGLVHLQHYVFPVELNAVTRGYFQARSQMDAGQRAADERAILAPHPRAAVIARLSQDPLLNATLRTTCVATRLDAGDANNALPQRATAIVNCRVLPGHSAAEIQKKLAQILADPGISVKYVNTVGDILDQAPATLSPPPVQLDPKVMGTLRQLTEQTWHIPVVPDMATGASDSKYTNAAGMPTYSFSGIQIDEDDVRAHGKNERLAVTSLRAGAEFTYRLLRLLTS